MPGRALQVAVVGRPHGVRGQMRLVPESGEPARLAGLTAVWLRFPASGGGKPGVTRFAVRAVRVHGGFALATLEGVEDRDAAARLTHAEAWAMPEELPLREVDEFAVDDVMGLELFDGDRLVGRVTGVADSAGRDYFEVERGARTVLVPAVKEWLVSREPGRIVMRLPAGLVEEQDS